jgi:DNA adenine methylase
MSPPTRPVLRYHGGKWRLAPWVISHFPKHRIYVEPFGGAASVLMRKPRSYGEVYNDLEDHVVNLFRILRDPTTAEQLRCQLEVTPFARTEFQSAYEPTTDPIEDARRSLVRAFMGFGSASMTRSHRTGFRSNSNRSGTTPAHDWGNWPVQVSAFVDRLKGVVIEHKHAIPVMQQHDSPDTLHYVDPPYLWSTRSSPRGARHPHAYVHEMNDDDHRALGQALLELKGMVVLSGYPCELYDREFFPDWRRVERPHRKDGARPSTEVLWINPACSAALDRDQNELSLGGAA